jgi:hypothetical protein
MIEALKALEWYEWLGMVFVLFWLVAVTVVNLMVDRTNGHDDYPSGKRGPR